MLQPSSCCFTGDKSLLLLAVAGLAQVVEVLASAAGDPKLNPGRCFMLGLLSVLLLKTAFGL